LDIGSGTHTIGQIHHVRLTHDRRCGRLLHTSGRQWDAFILVLSGRCRVTFDEGGIVVIQQGDLLYLPKNASYSIFILTEDYRPFFCNFEFAVPALRQYRHCRPADPAEAEKLFRRLLEAHRDPAPAARCEIMACLYSIYSLFLREEPGAYLPSSAAQKVAAARDIILTRCQDPDFSCSRLARDAGFSEVYFRKVFRAQYGLSPQRVLLAARLEKARALLQDPLLSLDECALQSGFTSLSYFCRFFRQQTGITPAKYRKQMG